MSDCTLESIISLTSKFSWSSVRLMWNRSRIWRTVDGPWPKQGNWEPEMRERVDMHHTQKAYEHEAYNYYYRSHSGNNTHIRVLPRVIWVVASQALRMGHQSEFGVAFPTVYSIVSGDQNSLSGGKRRLSGGWGRPPLTSVGRTMPHCKYIIHQSTQL